jgi:hypothetical protein
VDERFDDTDLACPACGSAYELDQEYCLECGARLPVSRMPTPHPRRWIWVAVAVAIVVAGAIVGLVAAADNGAPAASGTTTDTPGPTTTAPATGPDTGGVETGGLPGFETVTVQPPPTTGAIETGPIPGTTATIPTVTTPVTTTPPPATTQPAAGLVPWPSGTDGFTVVLASVLVGQGRAAADAQAAKAQAAGLPQVGILESSSYSSLRPGYYVVFSGIYSSNAQAQAAAPAAQARGFPGAYPREIAN